MFRKSIILVILLAILHTGCIKPFLPPESNPVQPTRAPSAAAPLLRTPSTYPTEFPTHTPIPPTLTPGPFPTCQADPLPPEQLQTTPFPIVSIPPTTPEPYPPLRALAEARHFFIGVSSSPGYFDNASYVQLFSQQFNLFAVENSMKWEIIHPQPDRYDFSEGDAIVSFAQKYQMAIFAHVLVWDLQLPQWVASGEYSRDEWIQILCRHIKTVVGHYRGQLYAWDVVNEAVNTDGTLYNNFWLRKIGPEYIPMAFQWAREADPSVRLFYNDNGGEGMNPKSQAIYTLLQTLKADGIPVDGVGLQMHTALYQSPTPQALQANMAQLADLGLEIQITEMDVRLQYSDDSQAYEFAAQAEIYRQAIAACLAQKACTAFIAWGLGDNYSWIPGWTGHPDEPLLFDKQGQPKPAYWAVHEELSRLPASP